MWPFGNQDDSKDFGAEAYQLFVRGDMDGLKKLYVEEAAKARMRDGRAGGRHVEAMLRSVLTSFSRNSQRKSLIDKF